MTLRHRLLLVYAIVILLSVGTVGMALFELYRSRQVFGALRYWNDVALSAQKLQTGFPAAAESQPVDFAFELAAPRSLISLASDYTYAQVDEARESLNRLNRLYDEWSRLPPAGRTDQTQRIQDELAQYTRIVDGELARLQTEVEMQNMRITVLPGIVAALTIVHIGVIAWLLRRWLLRPLEQLNRQVEALGRDQPPPEPLLRSPWELAGLARALDRARESLGSLRQQLIESERLTTIGQFAAQIAHNLRNPLASIRAAAQVSSRLDADRAATAQRMNDIVASVDRMNQWIAGLMEVARREPTATRQADVAPLLHRVEEALRTELAAKELTFTLDLPPAGLVCAHDPATLEHALIAMLVNAIEASPLGGRIVVRGEAQPGNGHRAHVCRIAVQDEGAGLPADDPERIFEVSYSTKQRGMGLGLALARQALQRQGGAAHAFNNPAGGATVYVELPVEGNVS